MKLTRWLTAPERRLDLIAGLIDGILTALALAAGRLLEGAGATFDLAVRVAIATGLANGFVFFSRITPSFERTSSATNANSTFFRMASLRHRAWGEGHCCNPSPAARLPRFGRSLARCSH